MRVALFTDTYPGDVNGVATTLGKLVAYGSARGHEFAVFSPKVAGEPSRDAMEHFLVRSVPLPFYSDLRLAGGLGSAGKRLLTHFTPDIIHVATEASVGLSGRIWAERRGIPLVTSYHTNFTEYVSYYGMGLLAPSVWRYLRWFHGAARVTYCPGRDALQVLSSQGLRRLSIWSRGVDTDRFSPLRRSEEIRARLAPGADRIMMYVGRLAPEKRLNVLMEAFTRVHARLGKKVGLVVVGDGPRRAALEASAPEGVTFTGYLRGQALAEAYAAADIFSLPSDTETFGNVVLEALASGVPAVVADRGGVKETVIPGKTGIRVEPGNAEAFGDACIRLLLDDHERLELVKGARQEALSRSWDAVLDGVISGYESVLTQPEKLSA